ncbi:MAG TPA: creatininase family protein [Thermodesulfobacteriota bacterium]
MATDRIPTFEEMTWPEVEAAVRAGAPILVSAGATEQHGEHLPLGSDTMQGIDISRRVARRLASEGIPVVVGPAVPYGPRPFLSESPRDFPGTISLSHATLIALFEEVCAQLIGHGFRQLYLLLCNAETDPVLQIVAKDLTERTEANVVTLNWLIGIRSRYKGVLRSPRPQGHGGEGETARMLATAPHLVRMDRARSYHMRPAPEPAIDEDRLPYLGGGIGRYRLPAERFAGFKGGIVGEPALATAETGEKIYGLITDWIAEVVRRDWAEQRRRRRAGRSPARRRR